MINNGSVRKVIVDIPWKIIPVFQRGGIQLHVRGRALRLYPIAFNKNYAMKGRITKDGFVIFVKQDILWKIMPAF